MTVISFGDAAEFDVDLKRPNIIASLTAASLATECESAKVTTPLVFDFKKDLYYEEEEAGYFKEVGSMAEIRSGLKKFKTAPDLTPHSYVKTCLIDDKGLVRFYLSLKADSYSVVPGRDWSNFNVQMAIGNWGSEVPNRGTGEKPNITTAVIAGEVHRITAGAKTAGATEDTFVLANQGFRKATGPQTVTNHELSVELVYSSGSSITHNLITGNAIRCITKPVGSILKENTIYYAIRVNSTEFKLSLSYADAIANVSIKGINSVNSHEFERQAGWIKIEEGDLFNGNGGDLSIGGVGNVWVRSPYNKDLNKRVSLGSYVESRTYNKGDRVLKTVVDGGVNRTYVWECLANQDINNAVEPSLGIVQADLTGLYGEAMLEIPETYIRKDYFDGKKWFNIKGKEVGSDYTILGKETLINQFSTTDVEQEFHVLWFITKIQYNQLSDLEKSKFYLNPAFHQTADSEEDRTYRLEAEEAGQGYTQFWSIEQSGSLLTDFYIPANDLRNNTWGIKHLHVGKLVSYVGNLPSLVHKRNYYIKETSAGEIQSYKLSETRDGNAIEVFGNGYRSYWNNGAIFPVVTKTAQKVISYNNGVFTTEFDHQFVEGQKVLLTYEGTNTNFLKNTFYYVDEPNYANRTFRLSTTLENALNGIIVTGSFSNTNIVINPEVVDYRENQRLRIAGVENNELVLDWIPGYTHHGLITGYSVVYRGSLSGLEDGATYYVRHISSTRVRLALTRKDAVRGVNLMSISGSVQGSSIEVGKEVDVVMPGNNFNVLSVNTDTMFNDYRVRYKGIFLSSNHSFKFTGVIIGTLQIGEPVSLILNSNDISTVNIGDFLIITFKGTEQGFLGGFAKGGGYWVLNKTGNSIQLTGSYENGVLGQPVTAMSTSHDLSNIILTKSIATSRKNEGLILNNGTLGVLKIQQENSQTVLYPKSSVVASAYGILWPHIKTGTKLFYCPRMYNGLNESGVDNTGIYHANGINLVTSLIVNNRIKLQIEDGRNQLVNKTLIKFRDTSGLNNVNTTSVYEIIDKQVDGTFRIALIGSTIPILVTGTPTVNTRIILLINEELDKGVYFVNVKRYQEIVTFNSNRFTSNQSTSNLSNLTPVYLEYDGDSVSPYEKGVYFTRDYNSSNRSFNLSKQIDSGIITGNLNKANIRVTTLDCRFSLHNSYIESINNQNAVVLSSQPDYNEGFLYTKGGTINAFNTYGVFYKANYYVTNGGFTQAIIWDAENRGKGFRPGDWLVDQVVYYMMLTEERSYYIDFTKQVSDSKRPYRESNRIALYSCEHVSVNATYNGLFCNAFHSMLSYHTVVKESRGYRQVYLRGDEQSYNGPVTERDETYERLLGSIIWEFETNSYPQSDWQTSVTSKAGFSYLSAGDDWKNKSLGGRIRGYANLGYRSWTDKQRLAWAINSYNHSWDNEWVANSSYSKLVR